MVTKEELENQKRSLETEYQQTIANGNAIKGALQLCTYLLTKFEEKTTEENKIS